MLGITQIEGKRVEADKAVLIECLEKSLSDYNIIMVIGGTGTEEGNITASAVASVIGYSAVMKDGEVFPEGAEIFRGKKGKPSGFAIAQGNQCIIAVPGDSESLNFMLCYRTEKYIAEFIGKPCAIRVLRAYECTKQQAEQASSSARLYGSGKLVFEESGEIALQVVTRGVNPAEAKENNTAAVKSIIDAMDGAVYAVDAENVGMAFGQELSRKGLKVAAAAEGISKPEIMESAMTAEYIDSYLGTESGLWKYDIPEKLLKSKGVVSAWTAAMLASEVSKSLSSNIGIGIVTDEKKYAEGAYVAVCVGDNVWTEKVTAESREALVRETGIHAVRLARSVVSAYPKVFENSVSLMGAVSGKNKFNTSESKGKWYGRFIPMKGDSKGELIRKSIFILCVVVFLGSAGYLGSKLLDTVSHKNLAASLQSLFGSSENVPDDWGYIDKLYALYEENNDLMAYVEIPDTNVSYPVVQTTKEGNGGETGQYYLRKDYYGAYSMYGTPFLDYRCNANPEYQSTNLIVYGHNIYDDGQMFSDLVKYRKLKFYKEHPVIDFDTLYQEKQWLIVGVIITNAYEKDGPVWNYNNFIDGTAETTASFISEIKKRSLIVTGVDYTADDHYLTLSTCCYDFKDARFVIVAREVREGEDISELDTSNAYYNNNPLMPDKWYQAVADAQKSESDASFGDADSSSTSSADGTLTLSAEEMEFTEAGIARELIAYLNSEALTATDLTWTSGNSDIATVDKYGRVTALANGTVTITATTADGKTVSCTIKVNLSSTSSSTTSSESTVETTVTLNKVTLEFTAKNSMTELTATVTAAEETNKTVEWTSSNPEVATVDKYGRVTAVANGEATITVKTADGKTATCKVTVKIPTSTSSSSSSSSSASSSSPSSSVSSETSSTPPSVSESESTSSSTSSATIPIAENTAANSVSKRPTQIAAGSNTVTNASPTVSGSTSSYYQQSLTDTFTISGNTISVFDAVCQIVAYEAGYGQPDEHVKAQAVASYTYVKNHGGSVSAGYRTTVTQQIKNCVAEVIGYAVLDNKSNSYILATYFSESSGYTADAEWVWGSYNRNLLSVSSPVDGNTEKTYTISSSDFASKVYSSAGISLSGDPSGWIKIVSRFGDTDYVNAITLGGKSYTGRKLRETVLGGANLRSTAFDVTYSSSTDKFTFTFRGYGHGVGMSAVGAIAYAKQGYSWQEILLKYYSNCYVGMKY